MGNKVAKLVVEQIKYISNKSKSQLIAAKCLILRLSLSMQIKHAKNDVKETKAI